MPRYFFDIRDAAGLCPDEEGLELPNMRAAEIEAARSLVGLARDSAPGSDRQYMAIEVRTAEGPAFEAAFVFELSRGRH